MYTEVTKKTYKNVVGSLDEMKKPASSHHLLLYERNRGGRHVCKFIYGSKLNKNTLDGDYCREIVVNIVRNRPRKGNKYIGVRLSFGNKEDVLKKTEDTIRNLFILLPFCERGRKTSSVYVSNIIMEENQSRVLGARLEKTWAIQILVKVSPHWYKTPFHTFHFLTLLRTACTSGPRERSAVLRSKLKKVPFHGFFSSKKMEPLFERNGRNLWDLLFSEEGDRTFMEKVRNEARRKTPSMIEFDGFIFSNKDSEKLVNYFKYLKKTAKRTKEQRSRA